MKIISYPQFLSDMENFFDKVVREQERYIMPWGDKKNIVMLSMEEYNELKRMAYEKDTKE